VAQLSTVAKMATLSQGGSGGVLHRLPAHYNSASEGVKPPARENCSEGKGFRAQLVSKACRFNTSAKIRQPFLHRQTAPSR
jgi:hypothetical protein